MGLWSKITSKLSSGLEAYGRGVEKVVSAPGAVGRAIVGPPITKANNAWSLWGDISGGTEAIGKTIAKGGVGAARLFYGNRAGRAVLSAGAGAIYGGMTSENTTSTGMFRDVLGGALVGAGLYGMAAGGLAATRKYGIPAIKKWGSDLRAGGWNRINATRQAKNLAEGPVRPSDIVPPQRWSEEFARKQKLQDVAEGPVRYSVAEGIYVQAGRQAARAAKITAGIGLGTGLAGYGISKFIEEPERDLGALAEQAGISSTGFDPGFGSDYEQQSHQRYMDSTQGLVQGLHRSRH